MLAGVTIIDADAHLLERPNLVAPHLEGPWLKGTRRAVFPGDAWDRSMEGKYGFETYDVPTRLMAMDTEGIDVSVLFPTAGLAYGLIADPLWAAGLARGYNDWLYDRYLRLSPSRIKGMALIPVQDPFGAATELRRAVTELGMVGGIPELFPDLRLG